MRRFNRLMGASLCTLSCLLAASSASATENQRSPLHAAQYEIGISQFANEVNQDDQLTELVSVAADVPSANSRTDPWSPLSFSTASFCFASGCTQSRCIGSLCAGNGGSVCIGSLCTDSLCIGSGCVFSVCVGSVCGGSVCALSLCSHCEAGANLQDQENPALSPAKSLTGNEEVVAAVISSGNLQLGVRQDGRYEIRLTSSDDGDMVKTVDLIEGRLNDVSIPAGYVFSEITQQ